MGVPAPIRLIIGLAMLTYLMLVALLLINFVVLLYIFVRPFSESRFLTIGCWIQGSFLIHFPFFMETLLNIKLDVRGTMPPAEAALVIANHLTHDWAPMYALAYRINTLPYVRTVIKKAVSYVPGLGWGMWVLYWPFVSRDFKKDETVLKNLFNAYERSGLPVQTWLYPEGTRKTAKKLADSQNHARESGYPVWNHVMLPRHRGFVLAVNSQKGAVRVIHEMTLAYEGWPNAAPTFWDLLMTDPSKKHVMHLNCQRTPISALPTDDEEKKTWLMDAFARKESLLDSFARDGHFPGPKLSKDVTVGPMVPHLLGWFAFTATLLSIIF